MPKGRFPYGLIFPAFPGPTPSPKTVADPSVSCRPPVRPPKRGRLPMTFHSSRERFRPEIPFDFYSAFGHPAPLCAACCRHPRRPGEDTRHHPRLYRQASGRFPERCGFRPHGGGPALATERRHPPAAICATNPLGSGGPPAVPGRLPLPVAASIQTPPPGPAARGAPEDKAGRFHNQN